MKTAEELQAELEAERKKNEENIKALQKTLSEKDVLAKKALEDLEAERKKNEKPEENKVVTELTARVEELSTSLSNISRERESQVLETKYPDIAPSLLVGKTEEEQTAIVTAQRERMKNHFGNLPSPHAPNFSQTEIDEKIKAIKIDPSLKSEEKIFRIQELRHNPRN